MMMHNHSLHLLCGGSLLDVAQAAAKLPVLGNCNHNSLHSPYSNIACSRVDTLAHLDLADLTMKAG